MQSKYVFRFIGYSWEHMGKAIAWNESLQKCLLIWKNEFSLAETVLVGHMHFFVPVQWLHFTGNVDVFYALNWHGLNYS